MDILSLVIGGVVGAVITCLGVCWDRYLDRKKSQRENRNRWERWEVSREPLADRDFLLAQNKDLIYEIRDWAGSVATGLTQGLSGPQLNSNLSAQSRVLHLDAVAAFLTFHEFPKEIEKNIVDLYVEAKYLKKEVDSFILGGNAIPADLLAETAEAVRAEANAIIRNATERYRKL